MACHFVLNARDEVGLTSFSIMGLVREEPQVDEGDGDDLKQRLRATELIAEIIQGTTWAVAISG